MVEMAILRSRYPKIFLYKNHQIQLFLTSNYPNFWFLALTQDPEKINTPSPVSTVQCRVSNQIL